MLACSARIPCVSDHILYHLITTYHQMHSKQMLSSSDGPRQLPQYASELLASLDCSVFQPKREPIQKEKKAVRLVKT